jgi:hypothetical protein
MGATEDAPAGPGIPEARSSHRQATALYLKDQFPRWLVVKDALPGGVRIQFPWWRITWRCRLGFDTTLTYQKLWKLCDFVRAGLPYIATHPDFNCPTGSGFMPDIGAMIAFVKAATGREPDKVVGKPNRTIVDQLARKLGLSIQPLAMVGDRLYTDIALGPAAGIPTVWSTGGRPMADLEGRR